MAKIRAIALTAWQETIRRQVFYIVLVILILVLASIGAQQAFLRMANQAGEVEMVAQMRASFVQSSLGAWNVATIFLALFLGAIGLSSEIGKKTIVHVLSRPVDRSSYLLGRWSGVLLFLGAFLGFGVLVALLLARIFSVDWTPLASLAVLEMAVSAVFYSGVSLGLSTFLPPILAGCGAFLLPIMPKLVEDSLRTPVPIWRLLAYAGYYLGPAKMPGSLLQESFSKQILHPQYGLYLAVLAENFGYAIVVFGLGCVIFARRELRLR